MSKKISIINAGNIYAQTLLKSLNGFNRVSLGDILNSRKSVIIKIKNLTFINHFLVTLQYP
jgi:hypothetical protein